MITGKFVKMRTPQTKKWRAFRLAFSVVLEDLWWAEYRKTHKKNTKKKWRAFRLVSYDILEIDSAAEYIMGGVPKKWRAIQCNTIQYNSIYYNIIQFNTNNNTTHSHNIILYNTL